MSTDNNKSDEKSMRALESAAFESAAFSSRPRDFFRAPLCFHIDNFSSSRASHLDPHFNMTPVIPMTP